MGFQTWLARRGIRGIAKSMCDAYKQHKAAYPHLDEPPRCREIIKMRYALISQNDYEKAVITTSIDNVYNMESACLLVVRAESGIKCAETPELMEKVVEIVFEEVNRCMKD